jgi:hypothetical protein
MLEVKPDLTNMQQLITIPQSYEGTLPSKPSSTIGTNIFGDIWSSQKNLGSSYFSYKG